MDMAQALEWAAKFAEDTKLFEPVLNARGYADGWKPPDPHDKSVIITELAKTVVTPVVSLNDVSNVCMHGALICAPCDFIPPSWRPSE
jgi:hypothetical protein